MRTIAGPRVPVVVVMDVAAASVKNPACEVLLADRSTLRCETRDALNHDSNEQQPAFRV